MIDRQSSLAFTWDGRSYTGFDGDTIASALAAAGVSVFSRSFKYHRPRGLLTASFHDPGCMVQVDDEPNVRGAHRRLEAGMVAQPQNAWPSLDHDVKAANQLVGRFLGAGFYYKTFIRPQRLWPAYEKVLSRFASGGRVTDRKDARTASTSATSTSTCAWPAAGRPGWPQPSPPPEREPGCSSSRRNTGSAATCATAGRTSWRRWTQLRRSVAGLGNLDVITNGVVAGRYDDNWLAVVERQPTSGSDGSPVFERLLKVRARTLVVAPGLIERPYVFAGNDEPGVLLSTAVRRLVNLWAVRPGERAVVLTANAEGDAAVEDLAAPGSTSSVWSMPEQAVTSCRPRAAGGAPIAVSVGDARHRRAHRLRPAGHGHRLDGAHVPAQPGGRPAGVLDRRQPVPPRRPRPADRSSRRRPGR